MMRVALSGGIASGKTTVSDALATHGVPIIDTDLLAREVVEVDSDGLQQVVKRFGETILDSEGKLDRKTLRNIVFTDTAARKDLEGIVHPLIRDRCRQMLESLEQKDTLYAVVVIPLLVETGQHKDYDHVIIVDVDPAVQIRRVMERDNCSAEQAQSILDSQASRKERLAVADDLILNSSTIKAVNAQVKKIHEHLVLVARRNHRNSQ